MRRVIFYSWQSDLPNPCNRGFIQAALEEAAKNIAADDSIAVEPVVDRDTQNVPGSPDIASTIFAKIAATDIFVADVSIVTRAAAMRPSPNPNVLIELGYALKALGHERVILVFNKSFGQIEELPFDLRMRRLLVYEMPAESGERAPERRQLGRLLDEALRAALTVVPSRETAAVPIPAVAAIENAVANRRIVLRRNLDDLLKALDSVEPKKPRDGGTADELIAGIHASQEAVAQFSKIAEAIAVMDDVDSALDLYNWFGKIFDRYNLPEGFQGRYTEADQDYFKFLGHELFVTLIAYLIREQRWETLRRVLDEPILARKPNRGVENVDWEFASEHLPLLINESAKRQRFSLHADLLKERHGQGGGLSTVLPLSDFMDADFFMFLRSRSLNDTSGLDLRFWRAWSCLYLKQTPAFIRNSKRTATAEQVAKALNLTGIPELKKLLAERGPEIRKMFQSVWWGYPIERKDIDEIGTR